MIALATSLHPVRLARFLVLVSLIGCATEGDDSGGDPDDPDGPTGPVADGEARAQVFAQGQPLADVPVVFHDASGAVLAVVPTAADGHADGAMSAGGMITVALSERELHTVVGVELGETITFGAPAADATTDEAGRVRLTGAPVLNTPDYIVDGGCHDMLVPALEPAPELAIGTACVGAGGRASVLVASRTRERLPYSWALASDIPVAAGQTAEASLGPWSTDWSTLYVTTRDLPAGILGLRGWVSAVIGDVPFRGLAVENVVPGYEGAAASFILGYPHVGDAVETRVDLVFGANDVPKGTSVMLTRAPTQPQSLTLQAAEAFLPRLTGVSSDLALPRARTTWAPTLDASLGVDAALVVLSGAGPAGTTRWTVMTDFAAGAVVLPELPPELSGPTSLRAVQVVAVADDGVAGLAAARTGAGTGLLDRPVRGHDTRVRYVFEQVP